MRSTYVLQNTATNGGELVDPNKLQICWTLFAPVRDKLTGRAFVASLGGRYKVNHAV